MEITEIRIKLMHDPQERLLAFCSLTLDRSFVIRDLKIIHGGKGPFVAMPSRKLMDHCPRCRGKNHLRAQFCNECGLRLNVDRAVRPNDGRAKLYADVAHPIHSDCRDAVQRRILESYYDELEHAKQPGYICTYEDYGEDAYATAGEPFEGEGELPEVLALPPRNRIDAPGPRPASRPHSLERAMQADRGPHVAAYRPGEEDTFGTGLV